MKGKLLFVAGLGVGYVLGARAGRKRYDQIAAAARKVWETPGIQSQVHQVQDFAAAQVGDIPGAIVDAGKKLVSTVVSGRRGAASKAQRGANAAAKPANAAATQTTRTRTTSAGAASTPATNTQAEKKPAEKKKSPAKKPAAKKPAASAAKKPAAKRPSGRTSSAKDGE